ncbi:MAG: hypothetical protein Kow0062_22150 [Acidobacteriota bacterium]
MADYVEQTMACALFERREQAEAAVRSLAEHGIEATIAPPGPRLHGIAAGAVELRVPMSQAARARALLARRG